MKRVSISLIYVAVVLFATSCMGTAYYEAYPSPTASLDIAPEGDTLRLKLVEWEWSHTTRFEPGVMPKHYRYRIVEDGVTGAESDDQTYESQIFLFDANRTGATKRYRIDVKIAEDYHDGRRGCRPYDKFGNWHTVYNLKQESM